MRDLAMACTQIMGVEMTDLSDRLVDIEDDPADMSNREIIHTINKNIHSQESQRNLYNTVGENKIAVSLNDKGLGIMSNNLNASVLLVTNPVIANVAPNTNNHFNNNNANFNPILNKKSNSNFPYDNFGYDPNNTQK